MREFRKPTVLAAMIAALMAGALAIGCGGDTSPAAPPVQPPPRLPGSVDVLVIGGGMAGTAAALSAAYEGASVLLVEKLGVLGGIGGGGSLGATNSSVQQHFGITDTDQDWIDLWALRDVQVGDASFRHPSFPVPAAVQWLVQGSAGMIDWLISHGGQFNQRPWSLAQDVDERFHTLTNPGFGGGPGLSRFLAGRAEYHGAEVSFNTRAVELIQEDGPGSRVVAVRMDCNTVVDVGAVILATGGFASVAAPWIAESHGANPADVSINVWSADLLEHWHGQGIEMGLTAGGELWEDSWVIGLGTQVLAGAVNRATQGMLFDSSVGERSGFENASTGTMTSHALVAQVRGGRAYWIVSSNFFGTVAAEGVPAVPASGMPGHANPADPDAVPATPAGPNVPVAGPTAAQLEGDHVLRAGSLEALAGLMAGNVNPADLVSAVTEFNTIAGNIHQLLIDEAQDASFASVDPRDVELFNTNPNTHAPNPAMAFIPQTTRKTYRIIDLDADYFYAVAIRPTIMGTFGGLVTELGTGRMLTTVGGDAIPGLYAIGEAANRNFFGYVYISGSASTQAVMTGRAAGAHAADFAME